MRSLLPEGVYIWFAGAGVWALALIVDVAVLWFVVEVECVDPFVFAIFSALASAS